MRLFIAALVSSLPLFATANTCRPVNSFEQGHELRKSQLAAAYNSPARIDVRGSWDVYVSGSYIYWQPSEENLEVGLSNTSPLTPPVVGNFIDMNFKFKNGYKVGLGVFSEFDNWDAYAEYTWLTGRHSTRGAAPLNGGITPLWGSIVNLPLSISSAKARWKADLDFLDLNLGRSYYVGTRLTFRPFFGVRAAWIHQKYVATYTNAALQLPYQVRSYSHSRGVGPEAGLDTSWLLGYGLRLIGKAEADIVFTRYNLRYKEQLNNNASILLFDFKQNHLYYLRPHANFEIGTGWGSYLNNHNFHLDLSATYNFQVFWNQNMFRRSGTNTPDGDLFIQGATGTIRMDF